MARLEDPDPDGSEVVAFSGDGSRLICKGSFTPSVIVWDLRAIRRQLADLGLDWDAPAYPAAEEPPAGYRPPPAVAFAGAELLKEKDPRKLDEVEAQVAVADLAINPFDAGARERLGREFLRQNRVAEAHAQLVFARALQPDRRTVWFPGAVAALRLGHCHEAIDLLDLHLQWQPDDAAAYLSRADAYEQLGERRRASRI